MENKSIPILYEGEGSIIQPSDLNAFRELNRQKNKKLESKLMTEEEAIDRFVKDDDYIGFELYGTVRAPLSLVRSLIRSGKKDFRLAGQAVHEADLLLGANLIREIDFTYIGLEVFGVSSNVRRRIESGDVKNVVEWSNASLTWRFKAAAMGIPFIATKCMLGSDTLKRSAAKVIECPFTGEKLALLPALVLDVAFIHVSRADIYGNCQIDGIGGFAFELSRACKKLIISAEEIIDTDEIRNDPAKTTIPYYLVDAVVHAPYASWPGEMVNAHEKDEDHYNMYLKKQKTEDGMNEYLKDWVYDLPNHQALLDKIGPEKLESLKL